MTIFPPQHTMDRYRSITLSDNEYFQSGFGNAQYFAELEAAYHDSSIVVPLTYNDPGQEGNFVNGTVGLDFSLRLRASCLRSFQGAVDIYGYAHLVRLRATTHLTILVLTRTLKGLIVLTLRGGSRL